MPATKRAKLFDIWAAVDQLNETVVGVKETTEPEFTLSEYAERYGVTVPGAKYRLEKMVKAGRLVSGFKMRGGARVKVYRFPESTS